MSEQSVVLVNDAPVASPAADSPAKPARAPRAPKAVKPAKSAEPQGVVGTLPVGFEELRAALGTVRAGTDMKPEALRKDAATVSRAVERVLGKKAMPPAGRGRWTGLRTYDFQNTLFAANDRPDWRFSDRALAIAWLVELASNKCDFAVKAHYVGSTRTDYLKGRHGSNVVDPKHTASREWPAVAATEAK